MKKNLLNYGGLILFYAVIIIGVIVLNARFSCLNESSNHMIDEDILAVNR